jgi:hypothetical protein
MKIEPRSDLRQAAAGARELFVAMVDAGFSEEQALKVVIAMLTRS